jgi:hypothetical protein
MDISNINAANAYTTNQSVRPQGDDSLVKTQDTPSPETALNQETARQQAFQVDITQEAQDRLAAETEVSVQGSTRPDAASGDGSGQSTARAQEARQIVNIVA